jgi:tRNA-specific 2-thiouridylase
MKTAIAMSGGVDSTAAAIKLLDEGHYCKGFLMKLLSGDKNYEKNFNKNLSTLDKVCAKLNMEYEVVDFSSRFEESVISYFIDVYKNAMTPNPCIFCNPVIKFGLLLDYVKSLGFESLATGHYATLLLKGDEIYLKKGIDAAKDQSYFLSRIPAKRFESILFPLGNTKKEDNVSLVKEKGLYFMKGESQEICFIPEDDYTIFLKERLVSGTMGNFIDCDEKVLGQHKGIEFYTIGQRRGLGVATGVPAYVRKINKENRTIEIGERIKTKEFIIKETNILAYKLLDKKLTVKVRYRHRGSDVCSVTDLGEGRYKIVLKDAEESLTPGQSAVFYYDDIVVASGFIEKY